MKKYFLHHKKIKIIILTILCITSLIWFIYSVIELRRSGELRTNNSIRKHYAYPNNIVNVNNITAWMTFDYINVIFKLDSTYLKNALMIDDTRYPNIRIDRYAKNHNINNQVFLRVTQQLITNYINNKK